MTLLFDRPHRRLALVAAVLLVSASRSPCGGQAPSDDIVEPVLGVTMGTNRTALAEYLASRGWRRVIDSVPGAVGTPSIFTGSLERHDAEIVALFGSAEANGRLLQLFIVFPSASEAGLRATYAWAYHYMTKLRCVAKLPDESRARVDSLANGLSVKLAPPETLGQGAPIAKGHAVLDFGNLDWPQPAWAAVNPRMGIALVASSLGQRTKWPYQTTLWIGKLVAVMFDATEC